MTFNQPWWERHRQVLADEEQALRELADDGTITLDDDNALLHDQIRRYSLAHTYEDVTLDLNIIFADQHPYFRPEVAAEQTTGVHQNPHSKELCLLEGDTWLWDLAETAGHMIASQLPKLLAETCKARHCSEPRRRIGVAPRSASPTPRLR